MTQLQYSENKARMFIIVILALFAACEKESFSGQPFYETIQGNWRVDSLYFINGQKFTFTDYDIFGTTIEFDKGVKQTVWNCGEVMVIESGTTNFMGLYNENGLIFKSETYLSDLPALLALKPGDGKSTFTNNKWTRLGFTNTHAILDDIYCKKYCDQGSSGEYDRRDCVASLQNHIQLDQVSGFSRYTGIISNWEEKDRYKLELISASEMQVTAYVYYYDRIIAGEKIFDEVKFRIFRLNTSDILSIPPFHPNNYSYSWWHSLGWAQNGLMVFGGSNFNHDGVDGKCLSINGFGQYAEFNKKPYAPMTMSFWVKPSTISRPKQVLYSKYKNQYGPFIFSLEQDKFVMEINDGNGSLQKVSSNGGVLNNEWNHICLTVDGNNLAKLYINGMKDSEGTINSLNNDAAGKILFGTAEEALDNGLDVNLRGSLDEIIFFNKVFAAGEVRQLYTWHLSN